MKIGMLRIKNRELEVRGVLKGQRLMKTKKRRREQRILGIEDSILNVGGQNAKGMCGKTGVWSGGIFFGNLMQQ